MENLLIDQTKSTPTVSFMTNGAMTIEGRSFSEDPKPFYEPLLSWCEQLTTKSINLVIRLNYLNTSATKYMSEIIKVIDANSNIEDKEIKWYFEEDDDDILEVGQIIEENTHTTKFYFFEIAETA